MSREGWSHRLIKMGAVFIPPLGKGPVLSRCKHHSSFSALLHSQLQKLCIQTWSLFAFRSRESEGLYPGSRCLCLHMQVFQRFMIIGHKQQSQARVPSSPGQTLGEMQMQPNMLIGNTISRNRNIIIYLYQLRKVHEKLSFITGV